MKLQTILMFLLFAGTLSAQGTGRTGEISIKTSAQCDMCKERIEETLAFTKGVKKAELDLESKMVRVVYRKGKTDPADLRKAISAVGYDADDVAADREAYEKLPACCKKPDDPGHEGH